MIKDANDVWNIYCKSNKDQNKIIIKQTTLRCVVYVIQQIKKQQVNQINGLVFIINFDEILEKIKKTRFINYSEN